MFLQKILFQNFFHGFSKLRVKLSYALCSEILIKSSLPLQFSPFEKKQLNFVKTTAQLQRVFNIQRPRARSFIRENRTNGGSSMPVENLENSESKSSFRLILYHRGGKKRVTQPPTLFIYRVCCSFERNFQWSRRRSHNVPLYANHSCSDFFHTHATKPPKCAVQYIYIKQQILICSSLYQRILTNIGNCSPHTRATKVQSKQICIYTRTG